MLDEQPIKKDRLVGFTESICDEKVISLVFTMHIESANPSFLKNSA